MGFLSNAAIGIGTGVFKQADQDYDDVANERQQMLGQRAKIVDQISQQHDKMEQDAQDTQTRMQSYQSQYNIPSDMAYTLATDPVVKTMKPDEVGDYVRRLKPTGQYMPPDPGKTAGYNAPGQTVNHGVMGGGGYSIPGIQAQPVQNSGFNQPRQIYSQTPPNPKYKDTMGPLPETTCQAVLGQRANLANWDADPNNAGKMPPTPMLTGAWSGGKDHGQDTNHKAFETALAGLEKDGNTNAFYATYKTMGGTTDGLKGFDPNLISGRAHADPVLEQKAKDIAAGIAQQYQGLDPSNPKLLVYSRMLAVPGSIHNSQDQNGQYTGSFNAWSGKPLPEDVANLVKQIKGPDDPANQPIPPGKTSTADIPPNGPQQDVIFTPQNRTDIPKQTLERVNEAKDQAPKILAAIRVVEAELQHNHNSVGIVSDFMEKFGGYSANLAGALSPAAGDWIANQTGQVDKQALQSSIGILMESLKRPIMSEYTLGRVGQGGSGGKDAAQIFDEAFGHSGSDTTPGLQRTLTMFKTNLLRNYASDAHRVWANEPQIVNNPNARVNANALHNHLTKNEAFGPEDADDLMAQFGSIQSGKGLK